MTDYTCPECGAGFPETHGRKLVDSPWRHADTTWWERWTWLLVEAMFMRRYYVIVCPNCGHTFGEDE